MRMRLLVAGVVLFLLGMVGVVLLHERGKVRQHHAPAVDENAVVATISAGERVDIEAHLARRGLTVIEFAADF